MPFSSWTSATCVASLPLVCHLWHQLSLSSCSTLQAKLETEAAAESLAAWVQHHGGKLEHLDLTISNDVFGVQALATLLRTISSLTQLTNLRLTGKSTRYMTFSDRSMGLSLAPLTRLTSLSLSCFGLTKATRSSLLSLSEGPGHFSDNWTSPTGCYLQPLAMPDEFGLLRHR